jgi:energy-coupling factor transport system ATP-binding protein
MTGLLMPQSGKIKILGQEINNINIKNIRNNIGIIFQNPDNQFVGLTVEDDIAFGLENHKVPAFKMSKIINTVATAVGIKHLLELPPSSLSGGQKQRVAIASVLAVNPKIIIFDESTSMLDPNAKEDLKDLMLDLKTKYGKTIISVTHDMEEVTKCDRVIVMDGGKVLKIGTPTEIFEDRNFLIEHSLDVPFNLQLCLELDKMFKKSGKSFDLSLDKAKIINTICKLEK